MNAFDEFLREHPTATLDVRIRELEFEAQVDLGENHARARAHDSEIAIGRAVRRMRGHLREGLPYSICARCGLETVRRLWTEPVPPCPVCWQNGVELALSSEEC